MSDMGWSRYIRDLDNAAYAQEKAEEQDMLPHLVKHCDYGSPAEMYRVFYKYTDCGPWVSVHVNGAWVHCGELHTLGTWAEMASRGDVVDEILVGSIVEGVDECAGEMPVRLPDIQSRRSKKKSVTRASLRSALSSAVAAVDESAKSIWNQTHGCDTCLAHWNEVCAVEHWGEDIRAVWEECPDCLGKGEPI